MAVAGRLLLGAAETYSLGSPRNVQSSQTTVWDENHTIQTLHTQRKCVLVLWSEADDKQVLILWLEAILGLNEIMYVKCWFWLHIQDGLLSTCINLLFLSRLK